LPDRPALPERPEIRPAATAATATPPADTPRPTTAPPAAATAPPQTAAPKAQPTPARAAATPPTAATPTPPPSVRFPDEPPDDTPSPAQLVEAEQAARAYATGWSAVRRGSSDRQGVYSAGGFLARQVPQNLIAAGIFALLAVCVLATIVAANGGETAAGLLVICVGPLALLLLGIGIALLFTRGRKTW
jgi:hypothetical protein